MLKRPSWHETGMAMAQVMSRRSVCIYHKVGCVFLDPAHRIVATGYNGPSTGDSHCDEVGCAKVKGDPETGEKKRCRGAHAEMNAIINARHSEDLQGSTLFVTVLPCYDCMKHLNNLRVARVVYLEDYERVVDQKVTESEGEVWEFAGRRGIAIERFKSKRRRKK